MVKQKTTSSATEQKYRWIQYANPLTATWEQVKPGTVTNITTSGYTNGGYGGLYKLNSNTYFVIANGSNGNWFGALGAWGTYNGGIPGYPNTAITTGYLDLYIRLYSGYSGQQGNQGDNGPQGYQGNQGEKGVQGPQGYKGDQGTPGYPGDQGYLGYQGSQGYKGNKGNKGKKGAQGLQGNKGNLGIQGTQGSPGIQGDQGDRGNQGNPGGKGNRGKQGQQGNQGVTGSYGSQGPQGYLGNQGSQGSQGDKGVNGVTSGINTRGAQGTKGSKGAAGENLTRNSDDDYSKYYFTALFGGTYMRDITSVIYWGSTLANIDVSTINFVGGAFKRWHSTWIGSIDWKNRYPLFMSYGGNPYQYQ